MKMEKTNQTPVSPEKKLYDELYAQLRDGADTAVFDYDCRENLFDTFRQMCGEHPELFWLDGGGNMRMTSRGSEITLTLTPTRTMTAEETESARVKLSRVVSAILRPIPKTASDYDKVLAVHDWIVEHTEYDHAALEQFQKTGGGLGISSNAYGCLIGHTAVCSGYSAAFQLLMNELNVPCRTVTGSDRRSGVPHAWNLVQVSGDWYYMDVTWDDPTYAEGAGQHGINRDCFLITTAELLRDHAIGKDQNVPSCTAVKENYYVKNGLTVSAYSLEAAADVLRKQLGKEELVVKFPSAEEAQKGCEELFGKQEILKIVPDVRSLRYSIGKTGALSIRVN